MKTVQQGLTGTRGISKTQAEFRKRQRGGEGPGKGQATERVSRGDALVLSRFPWGVEEGTSTR